METVETTAAQALFTLEEYLTRECKALTKREYRNGLIHATPGASREHNLITVSIPGMLHFRFRERTCDLYSKDMRIKASAAGLYTYPDVVVVCDEPRFDDTHFDVLLNPTVLIEVLSPSTAAYDRGETFAAYQKRDSLYAYVLVSQDRVRVEHFLPEEKGGFDGISFLDVCILSPIYRM